MATVRIRDASEYSEEARKLFERSNEWFAHYFAQPPAMSRVMAWDMKFGGPHRQRCGAQWSRESLPARRRRWLLRWSAA